MTSSLRRADQGCDAAQRGELERIKQVLRICNAGRRMA